MEFTMAEEATVTGDDQKTEDTQKAGEDQNNSDPEKLRAELTAKEEELKNTNAYITRMQQQQAEQKPAASQQQGAEDTEEVDIESVPPEQRKLIQKLSGADDLREEIASIKKERENERQQAQRKDLENSFKDIATEYKDKGVPLPTSIPEKEALMKYMDETKVYNPKVAFREMHSSRLEQADKTEAATSDKSDSEAETKQNAYREALKKAKNLDEVAEVEAQFKGDPTQAQ